MEAVSANVWISQIVGQSILLMLTLFLRSLAKQCRV